MRRGQMEAIGLVFVVLIIIIGIVLYVKFSSSDKGTLITAARETQKSSSFLVALSQTTVPACNEAFGDVVHACLASSMECGAADPCDSLKVTMDEIAPQMLPDLNYSLRVESGGNIKRQTGTPGCNSLSPAIAGYEQPLNFADGTQARIVLTVCR